MGTGGHQAEVAFVDNGFFLSRSCDLEKLTIEGQIKISS